MTDDLRNEIKREFTADESNLTYDEWLEENLYNARQELEHIEDKHRKEIEEIICGGSNDL